MKIKGNTYSALITSGILFLLIIIVAAEVREHQYSFLHTVNLIFHEAGHTLLIPFGETLHFLGGTIGQLAVPLIFAVSFLRRGDVIGLSVMTWWFGENLVDVSVYVSDASTQLLPLIGGNHDWAVLLSSWGIIQHDTEIARALFGMGVFIMALSAAWIGRIGLTRLSESQNNSIIGGV